MCGSKILFIFFFFLLVAGISKNGISQSEITSPDTTGAVVDTVVYILDEVVTTGTRYEKKIIDIPYSVTRLDNTQFKFARKAGVNDVLETIPGMFLQSRYGNHDVRISIRGFGSRSNSGIRGVRILLDDIPESEPDGQTRIEAIDFNSVGRIEVVKGNLSSLYNNSPGGVVNFINDIYFPSTFVTNFNDFGSFDLRRNGFKTGIRTKDYAFLMAYSYHNYQGFREHSEDFWHIFNTVLETTPTPSTNLQILGYYVDGLIRLPGSLTKEEFDEDPFQTASREKDFDFRRVSKKGRIGVRYSAKLDKEEKNEIQLTGYSTIKYFERPSGTFRVINRYGVGSTARYLNRSRIANRNNEFTVGGDLLFQTGPIERYRNIAGNRDDILLALNNNSISNVGAYFLNTIDLVENRLSFLFSGRYDKIVFDQKNQLLAAQNERRRFESFTPKFALNYKLTPSIALYSSYASSFVSPANNELDNPPTSSDPGKLINPDIEAQESKNFELGIKGQLINPHARFFKNLRLETTFFHYKIDKEIVPAFEFLGEVFFTNAAQSTRNGLEFGGGIEIYDGFNLDFTYSFSDFVYDEYVTQAVIIDDQGQLVTTGADFSGNILPSIPRRNLFLSLAYAYPFSRNASGFARISHYNVSGLFVDDANSDKTDGYRLLNAALGFDLNFSKFNMQLSGGINNIGDVIYVGFVNINSAAGQFYEAGAPRNYFGSVKFGYVF